MTPLIAPEAPTIGIFEAGFSITWSSAADNPHNR